MARLTDLVFDSFDPPMLARFWANALDNYGVRPYSEEDIKLLAEHGLTLVLRGVICCASTSGTTES